MLEALKEKTINHVKEHLFKNHNINPVIIGFKGSYSIGLNDENSDIDIIAWVHPDPKEMLFGHRPFAKEYTTSVIHNEQEISIDITVQSILHIIKSLHKAPYNTLEVFMGEVTPDYKMGFSRFIVDVYSMYLLKQEAWHVSDKNMYFIGKNLLSDALRENNPKKLAKAKFFKTLLSHKNGATFLLANKFARSKHIEKNVANENDLFKHSTQDAAFLEQARSTYFEDKNQMLSDNETTELNAFFNNKELKEKYIEQSTVNLMDLRLYKEVVYALNHKYVKDHLARKLTL